MNERQKKFEPSNDGSVQRRPFRSWYQKAFEVSQAVPNGVLCLFSALEMFGVAKNPTALVWIAIPNKARIPTSLPEGVRVLRFSDESLAAGKCQVAIGSLGQVAMHSPAKAIVDCFKFRLKLANELGISMAELLGLLRDLTRYNKMKGRKVSIDAICSYLDVCRMRRVMGPYLDALGATPVSKSMTGNESSRA